MSLAKDQPAISNAQKKKQKKQKDTVPLPIAEPQPPQPATPPQQDASHSPVLELLHKRTRNFTKKIQRIKEYLAKPSETLNADQVKAIASLPQLEAVVNELEDIKKFIEPIESQLEQAHASAVSRLQHDTSTRVNDAVAATKLSCAPIFSSVVSLISSDLDSLIFSDATEPELDAVRNLAAQLKKQDPSNDEFLAGLVTGVGTWHDIPFTRLLQLLSNSTTASPAEVETVNLDAEEPLAATSETTPDAQVPVTASSIADGGLGGSFHFMQASELDDGAVAPVVNGVHHNPSVEGDEPDVSTNLEQPVEPETEIPTEAPVEPATAADSLDWAADDSTSSELPSINSLHAKFGTSPAGSGTATPTNAQAVDDVTKTHEQPTPAPAEEGFVSVRRGAPRGEGFRGGPHGGERGRGGGRGGFRGGRGGWRGDSEFRGRGGFRGGDGGRGWRGERGGPRGGPRGRGSAPTAGENTAS